MHRKYPFVHNLGYLAGFPMGGSGGVDPQCGCFSAKTYVKMKELGPGGERVGVPGTPHRSANV